MSVALDLVLAAVGIALVIGAAERLVAGTVGTALALRLPPFTIAAVFIGFDPENLVVGATAARDGSSGIAMGSIIGAAMVAIALAFGITALITPVRIGRAHPALLGLPPVSAALFALVAIDGELSRVDGVVLLAAYVTAIAVIVGLGRHGTTIGPAGEVAETLEHPPGRRHAVGLLVVSLAVLVVGSELLVEAARDLIDAAGWSETAAGMSLVALAVSAEELARELPAARRGHADITVGNVAGSVLAFLLCNAGVIALVQPVEVGDDVARVQLPIALATIALVTLLLWRGVAGRAGGLVLVLLYGAFLVSLA